MKDELVRAEDQPVGVRASSPVQDVDHSALSAPLIAEEMIIANDLLPDPTLDGEVSDPTDPGISEPLTAPVELAYDPDLWLYRERTIALLKRYLRISVEVGRLPSLLGRELFRSKVTSYSVQTFEDAVIFVHDVESVKYIITNINFESVAQFPFKNAILKIESKKKERVS